MNPHQLVAQGYQYGKHITHDYYYFYDKGYVYAFYLEEQSMTKTEISQCQSHMNICRVKAISQEEYDTVVRTSLLESL